MSRGTGRSDVGGSRATQSLESPGKSSVPVSEQLASERQMTAFQPEDLLCQAQIQDSTLAPVGSTVVYSRRVIVDNAYRTHLWIVPWSGALPAS